MTSGLSANRTSLPARPGAAARRARSARQTSRAETAAEWAEGQVRSVADDPLARCALLKRTYDGPAGDRSGRLPFARAALSFMRWQVRRGLLQPLDAAPPGSEWWRAVNERLLRDGCEARALTRGLIGRPSSRPVGWWLSFIADPTAGTWYRAHNASIVAGYLEQHELAARESEPERFFMNVALARVLYAHALVAAPRLALGQFAVLGPLLGDPRLGMAGAFLSLNRVLPNRYPLARDLDTYMRGEHHLGRMLDYAVIAPRLQQLYEWSAVELREPGVLDLVTDGHPSYGAPARSANLWRATRMPWTGRILQLATG